MSKTFRLAASILVAFVCSAFISCADSTDDDDDISDYSLSDLYGYTYSGTIYASSGDTLYPELIIYDSSHVSWSMSAGSYDTTIYYYTSQKKSQNVYLLYWYGSASAASANDTSTAPMTVTIGINSTSSLSVVGMGSTVVSMTRTSDSKTTYSGSDSEDEDVSITVSGESAEWFEESKEYSGTIALGISGAVTAQDGTFTLAVKKSSENTVSVVLPEITGMGMAIKSFTVEGVSVLKDGDVYYLQKGEFTASSNYTIAGTSLVGKYENGILTVRTVFAPGAMPMDLIEVFTSN